MAALVMAVLKYHHRFANRFCSGVNARTAGG
jgi:hypothetical protein